MTGSAATTVEIRPLHSTADFRACVELQREIWGREQPEIVPATLLHVVEYVGGVAAGAFTAGGDLVGFVFGVSGVRNGVLSHWSHQLGVRPEVRNLGVGRMLKEHQRRTLAAIGVAHIYWSFDPLMAKNAYLNLNRLGASVVEYVPDMYGTTESPLHLGMPTDRLIACLETAARRDEPLEISNHGDVPVLTDFPRPGDRVPPLAEPFPDVAAIEIPEDMLEVVGRSPDEARRWRMSVRAYFQWALARGFRVRGIRRDRGAARAFYVIERAG